jgi:YegS/Rv2252/BmrU family lipid kinase
MTASSPDPAAAHPVRRALLVSNARAGGEDAADRDRIAALLGAAFTLEVHELAEGSKSEDIARSAIERGADVLVAAGGDGTVSFCASAVIGTDVTLGIVPCGTSNSICRALGLPTDIDGACAVIAAGATRRIDAARVSGRAMVLLASIGFHADTIDSTSSESKSALGKLAYVLRGIEHLGDFEPFSVRIETDRGSSELSTMALTIANLAPPETLFAQGTDAVRPDDGLLDLTIVSAATVLDAVAAGLELAISALAGTEAGGPHVGWTRCTHARIVADPPQQVLVDGDMIGTTPLDVQIVPMGLRIACPAR